MSFLRIWALAAFTIVSPLAFADTTANVPTGDAAMQVAYTKARASLDEFLEKLKHPPVGTQKYSVKIGLKDGPGPNDVSISRPGEGKNEFFWVLDVAASGTGFKGKIANRPALVKNIAAGQTITFTRDDIADWMYFSRGKIVGNFTACPALAHAPKEEADMMREKYGLDCR